MQYIYSCKANKEMCKKVSINMIKSLKFSKQKICGSHVGTVHDSILFGSLWHRNKYCWKIAVIDVKMKEYTRNK